MLHLLRAFEFFTFTIEAVAIWTNKCRWLAHHTSGFAMSGFGAEMKLRFEKLFVHVSLALIVCCKSWKIYNWDRMNCVGLLSCKQTRFHNVAEHINECDSVCMYQETQNTKAGGFQKFICAWFGDEISSTTSINNTFPTRRISATAELKNGSRSTAKTRDNPQLCIHEFTSPSANAK